MFAVYDFNLTIFLIGGLIVFKGKSSIKAALSAIMASSLFCLCLGKSVCAEIKISYSEFNYENGSSLYFKVSGEDGDKDFNITITFENLGSSELKGISINNICKSKVDEMVKESSIEEHFCDRFNKDYGSFDLSPGQKFSASYTIPLKSPSTILFKLSSVDKQFCNIFNWRI